MELISVIVPVYNVEAYVDRCIESIINQTYRYLEIILIDDGSTDNSPKVLEKWAKRDQRVVVFHQENRGVSAARNIGLDHAHGQYIGFVDADDYIEACMYETLYKAIKKGAQIAVIGNNRRKLSIKDGVILNQKDSIEAMITFRLFGYVWDKLFERCVVENVRFMEGMNYEDGPFSLEAFFRAKTVVVCSKPLYYYRDRIDSITQSESANNYMDYATALELMGEIIKRNDSERRELEKLYLLRNIWDLCVIRVKFMRINTSIPLINEKISENTKALCQNFFMNFCYFASVDKKEFVRFLMVAITPRLAESYIYIKGFLKDCICRIRSLCRLDQCFFTEKT